MKKILVILLAFTMVFALAACGGGEPADTSSEEESRTLRFNVMLPAGSNGDVFANEWADLVEERTDGAVKIDVYPGSQLAGGIEQFESVEMGAIDIGWADSSQLVGWDRTLELLTLPFLISSFEELEIIYDGEIGDMVEQTLIENGNMRWLAPWWIGPRQMFTKNLLTSFEDCKGIKVRSPEVDLYIQTFNTLGMNPTPIAWVELYTSLESGIVDAGCCNLENIYSQQFYSICPYIWLSNHIWQVGGPIINEDIFQSFDAETQQILIDTAQEIAIEQRASYIADEQDYIDKIKAEGATVSPLETFTELDLLYSKLRDGFWLETAQKYDMEDKLDMILETLGK